MKVLLLTIDAWRTTHASFHPDAERRCTPELAALAERGVVFSRAFSHGPATPYAFPAIHTSTYPLDYGGYERLDEQRTLLSEVLADAGWRCVGTHSNPWLGEKYGYARGYDEYRDVGEFGLPLLERGREALVDRFGLDHPVYRAAQSAYRRFQPLLRSLGGGRADEVDVVREAFASGGSDGAREAPAGAGDGADEDLFVWAHLLAPHAPYAPPRRHREAEGVGDVDATDLVTRAQRDPGSLSADERALVEDLYAASVRHADERAGEMLERVDDDTLVVVTADHGEALFEHGIVGHPPRLYDELLKVPLVVRPPRGTSPRLVEQVVRHVDVAPTVLDYAGVSPPASYRGRSLRPAIAGEGLPPEPAVLEVASTTARPGTVDPGALRVGVRSADRKLVHAEGRLRGFDLAADPDERDPVDAPEGDEWVRLRRTLRDRRDEIAFEESGREFDAATEERLRDLGYLE